MKNLNLFRKSARGSEGSTLASAVVRPSLDRRLTVVKHLAFMLLFLLGSMNVWGTDAAVDDVLWAETWTGATTGTSGSNTTKASANCSTSKGTTMWGGATITYAESANTVYVRNDALAKGTAPELMFTSSQTWTISSIPTGNATEMTLTFKNNNNKASVTCTTTDVTCTGSITGNSTSGYVGTFTIDNSEAKASTITLQFSNSGNTRLDDIQLVVKTAAAGGCDKKVTITPGTPEIGASFNLSKTGEQDCCNALVISVTDIVAPTGKRFSAITQSGIATGVTIDQSAKTVTYAAETTGSSTINVEFEDLPKFTVTLKDDETKLTQESAGASVSLPARAGCTGYTFAGWTKSWNAPQSSWTTTAPDIIPAGNYVPEANENLYPVYTKTEGGGSVNASVTKTANELAEGKTISAGSDVTCYTSLPLNSDITLSTTGTPNCGSFWVQSTGSSNYEWRLYQNKSGNAIITAGTGCALTSVNITFAIGNTGTLGTLTSGEAAEASGSSATYTVGNSGSATNGQIKIRSITVNYTKPGSVTSYISEPACAAPGTVATPSFSVTEGTYNTPQSVALSCETDGATIYYTTDGTDPTTNSSVYENAISVNQTMTIKALAVKNDMTDSQIASATYTLQCAAPTFTPEAGIVVVGNTVTISSTTEGATIYYTTDGTDPSTISATTLPVTITGNTTIRAIAVKDGYENSAIAEAEYTALTPLTSMGAIHTAAETAGKTATTVAITFDSWVVTGVSKNGKNAYLSDDAYKGLIIFDGSADAEHPVCGLAEGDVLSGTAICKIQLYNRAAELTTLNASDLTITHNGAIPLHVVAAADVASLDGQNVGSLIQVNGKFTYESPKYYIQGLQLYNSLYTYTNPNTTNDYNCTGVFVIYVPNSGDDVPEICPRKQEDIEMVTGKTLSSITLGGGYPTVFEQGDIFSHAGMTVTAHYSDESTENVTEYATFSGYDMSSTGNQMVTVSYTENTNTKTTTYNITINTPTPTGNWELLDGELTDGDYLIYDEGYQGSLMLAEIANDRFNYELATPDGNGIISNPSKYAVWTLTKSGDYWTFYNSKAGMYAAGTGVNNKGQLIEDGTSDYAKWSISDELVVTNKGNNDGSKNATLRHNYDAGSSKNYGFACYAANTGHQPVFYKQAIPSYYITETLTGCSANALSPQKVPQALTENVVLKYDLSLGYVWPENVVVKVGDATLDPNAAEYVWDNTKTPAELTIDYTLIDDDIEITIAANERTLSSIAVEVAPTKVDYYVGNYFDPAGLQIKLNYTAGDPEYVTYNDLTEGDFTFSPDLSTSLETTDVEVTITYGGKSTTQAISVTEPTPVAKTVVILAEFDSKLYAMTTNYSSSACAAIEVTKDGSNIVVASAEDKEAIQWLMTTTGDNVTLQFADAKYLSSTSSNANLSKQDEAANWSITQADGKYLISIGSTRALMYKNTNVFKHYSVGGSVDEYAKVSEIFEVAENATNIIVEPVYTPVRSGLEVNRYYTVCLPKAVTAVRGATFWTLNNKSQDGATAYLEEETNNLPFAAGKPFIIQATAAQLEVVYEGDATDVAGTNGALHGTLVYMNAAALADAGGSNVYMLFSNELRPVGENNHLDANRAYVLLSELNPVAEAPQSAPGRRVRAMPMAPQVATGVDKVPSDQVPNTKVLINGQLYIMYNGTMYNVQGQLVK